MIDDYIYIRVVQTTTEGDLIITDIQYDSNKNTVNIIRDTTRDKFSIPEDRKIKHFNYEKWVYWKIIIQNYG